MKIRNPAGPGDHATRLIGTNKRGQKLKNTFMKMKKKRWKWSALLPGMVSPTPRGPSLHGFHPSQGLASARPFRSESRGTVKRATFTLSATPWSSPFQLPAVIELGTAIGFDFQLLDRGATASSLDGRLKPAGLVAQIRRVMKVRPNSMADVAEYRRMMWTGKGRRARRAY